QLNGPPDLPAVYAGGHNGAECPHVEEVGAHEGPQLVRFGVILRIEPGLFGDFGIVRTNSPIGLAVLLVQQRAVSNIDRVTGGAGPSKLHIVADLALEADVGNEAATAFRVEPRQVARVRI